MHKLKFKRLAVLLFAVLTMLCMTAGLNVSAESAANSRSMTLICRSEKTTLIGMQWKIYRVGSRQNNNFVLEGDFADYPVSFDDLSTAAITEAAETLENYAVLDGIAALDEGVTDNSGELVFYNLEPGMYLLSGTDLQVGNTVYVPSAILIEVSNKDVNVDTYPKFAYRTLSDETKNYNVKKIWQNDENHPEGRSVSISVEIYRNDVMAETVVLDESNDWSYSWEDDSNSDWRVKEADVPENYTVTYRSNETQIAIINTYQEDVPEATTASTQPTENTTVTATDTSNKTTENTPKNDSKKSYSSNSSNSSKLPQTGQLWWPVPVLACGGAVFAGVGLRLQVRNKKDDD